MKTRERASALFASIAFALAFSLAPANAQSGPTLTASFSFTAVNQQVTLPIPGGQTTCAVVVNSVGGGATLVPSASSDNATYTPVALIGNGAITAVGVYIGSTAQYGLAYFRVQVTALTSGTASGSIACSPTTSAITTLSATSGPLATQAQSTCLIAAGTSTNTTCKTGAGRLFGVVCTSTGTNVGVMNITDNANIIAVIPATCAAGTVVALPLGGVPDTTNIVVTGQSGAPALTVTYS